LLHSSSLHCKFDSSEYKQYIKFSMGSTSRTNGPNSTIGVGQAKTYNKYKGQELSNLPPHYLRPPLLRCSRQKLQATYHVFISCHDTHTHTHTHIHQPLEQAPYNHSRKNVSNLELECTSRLKFGSVRPQRLSYHYVLDVYLGKKKKKQDVCA